MSEMLDMAPAPQDEIPFTGMDSPDVFGPELPGLPPGMPPMEQTAEPAETDVYREYADALAPWGGGLAMGSFVEVKLPVAGMTETEKRMPGMLGGAMEFTRMMQEGIWATVLQTELPPPTETVRIPLSMN